MNLKSNRAVVLILAAVLLAAGALWRGRISIASDSGAGKFSLTTAAHLAPVSLGSFQNGFSSVIVPALPAVVNISSSRLVKPPAHAPDIFRDPFFRRFFGDQEPFPGGRPRREVSLGSGVIVNPNGYILTNNHVVQDASEVDVFTQSRSQYKAKVVGGDPRTDVAVLKIEASRLPVLAIGDSSKLKVGDLVFAIGDPFGVGETATSGIVSATGRGFGGAIERYEDFIQTDAAVNPGNSGGALIDLHGTLVGINTAIVSGGGGNEGVGFAIPINLARYVMDQIMEHGKVVRGYLGVVIQDLSPDLAAAFGLSHGGGALVSEVAPDSPAAKAGISRGDIVLEMNGEPIESPDQLSVRVSQMAPGQPAHLKIFRNGKTQDLNVTLAEYPQESAAANTPRQRPSSALQGLEVQNLTPAMAQRLNLPPDTQGVVVTQIEPSSPAETAGIQPGDVIEEVNRMPVRNLREYDRAVAGAGNSPILLLINSGGHTQYVILQAP